MGWYKTWTLDSGLDYGLNYGLDYELDYGLIFGLKSKLTLRFQAFTTSMYLIASSLVSKVRIIEIPMHVFGIDVSV